MQKNGKGNQPLWNVEVFQKREQVLEFRAKVLQAEQERLDGANTMNVNEARLELKKLGGDQ